jgi:tetratricopeptide (TPR) repeat protein
VRALRGYPLRRVSLMSLPAVAPTLLGLEIALAGRFASMTRAEAVEIVESRGGRFVEVPTASTHRLVVGLEGCALRRDGQPVRSLAEARRLQDEGAALKIVDEAEFLAEAGLSGRVHPLGGLYTIGQLSRMLDVPAAKLRAWVRSGLIRPQKRVRRLCWFDFPSVSAAKSIQQLVDQGVPVSSIERGLRQLGDWLPADAAERTLRQLQTFGRRAPMVFRLDDGQLVEANGQLHLPFVDIAPQGARTTGLEAHAHRARSPQHWFASGVEAEDAGRYSEAEEHYTRSLLAGGAKPETNFNLGNVFMAMERPAEAVQRFSCAVELDPEYVEAWNNLGNALAEVGRYGAAVRAYRRALDVEPEYADAHFNLAETCHQVRRFRDAKSHWLAYLGSARGPVDRAYVERMIADCDRYLSREN